MPVAAIPKLSVADRTGRRGAGFGNELIPWAKSYIAARALGRLHLRPRWAPHRYRLAKQFGWSPTTTAATELLTRTMRSQVVTEDMFRSCRTESYSSAIQQLADAGHLDAPVLRNQGMWGGYLAIAEARSFIRRSIDAAPGVLRSADQFRESTDGRFTIAIHIRRGDFSNGPPARGQFNRCVPDSWYARVITGIAETIGPENLDITVFGSEPPSTISASKLRVRHLSNTPLQDLALLSRADLLVASVSSFSLAAAFLSRRPYLWYEPQLTIRSNAYTLWGTEGRQLEHDSPTSKALLGLGGGNGAHPRGIPIAEDGQIPSWLASWISCSVGMRNSGHDLLYFGAAPIPNQPPRAGVEV